MRTDDRAPEREARAVKAILYILVLAAAAVSGCQVSAPYDTGCAFDAQIVTCPSGGGGGGGGGGM